MHILLQVAAGGAFGAVLRYLAVTQCVRLFGAAFPYGTMIVNVAGSFLMGALVAILIARGHAAPFLTVGVLGGFTTFSAFSLDAVTLAERGEVWGAFAYVTVSVLGSIAALALGLVMTRSLLA